MKSIRSSVRKLDLHKLLEELRKAPLTDEERQSLIDLADETAAAAILKSATQIQKAKRKGTAALLHGKLMMAYITIRATLVHDQSKDDDSLGIF